MLDAAEGCDGNSAGAHGKTLSDYELMMETEEARVEAKICRLQNHAG